MCVHCAECGVKMANVFSFDFSFQEMPQRTKHNETFITRLVNYIKRRFDPAKGMNNLYSSDSLVSACIFLAR